MNDAVSDGAHGLAEDALVPVRAQECELVIFDLDGVLTRTARVHAAAWKELFDTFLAHRLGPGYRPFDVHADYLQHVDGKPRLDGVRDFLSSRGIVLEPGTPDDPPGETTLWSLGNAKNRIFLSVLEREGVETYAPAVALVERLRACGIGCAVVSASRNCRRMLDAAGLSAAMDTVVDGDDAAREHLAGKPAPDTFLAAARRLQVPPSRAAVIEDAEAGITAARAGRFGLVIGVDRADHARALRASGADHVVHRLDRLQPEPLPSALDAFDALTARLAGRPPVLFLDYDGTLTPIVARPEDAVLAPSMTATLASLVRRCAVVVVTGRGLDVIRSLAPIDGLGYAADHGFQVQLEGERPFHPPQLRGYEAVIVALTRRLRERLAGIDGALVEPKRYSVAVHYRLVDEAQVDPVKQVAREELAREPGLRLLPGKKVLEFQPRVDWDKGAAVDWLMQHLDTAPEQVVYVGDDTTDESAFRCLRERGVTVAVQDVPRPTAAGYRLASVAQVETFLERMSHLVDPRARR